LVEKAFTTTNTVAIGWIATAFLLLTVNKKLIFSDKSISDAKWTDALIIGIIQGLSIWPGLSRSGSTIAVAVFLGWRWSEAAKFSFLISIPAILGANLLLIIRGTYGGGITPALTGFAASFVFGLIGLNLLMRFLKIRLLWPFAAYCIIASIGVFIL